MIKMGFAGLMLMSMTSLVAMIEQAATQPFFFAQLCVTTQGNYSANSTYGSSVKTVVSDLVKHAPLELFYNSSAGSGPSAVYGQYLCRGDVDSSMCSACIELAAQSLLGNCTLVRGGIIWFEQCTLRYSNASMAGVEAEYPRAWINDPSNVTDPLKFASVLDSTVNSVIDKAAGDGNRFATGEAAVSPLETLYCLVQCTPDLNATQCDTCLRSTYAFIPACCVAMAKQVAVFYASCHLRYTTRGPFYSGAIVTSPTTPPPPPPPPLAPAKPKSSAASIAFTTTGATIVIAVFICLL